MFSSPWFIAPIIIAAAGGAWLLYRTDPFSGEPGRGNAVFWLMAAARFAGIFSILILLLNPLITSSRKRTEKPVFVVAIDNSESMVLSADSTFLKNELPAKMEALQENLGEKYEVRTILFGEKVSDNRQPDYTDRLSNFSGLFDEVRSRFYGRNLGSILILSDGIFNTGNNPLFVSNLPDAPFHTLAIGDTTLRRDVKIREARFNATVLKGNRFPVELEIRADGCSGEQVTLKVSENEKELYSETFSIGSNSFGRVSRIMLDAPEAGKRHLVATVSNLPDEQSYANNRRDIFIEVIEARQKVLILMEAPHPDVAALRGIIDNRDNLEAEVALVSEFKGNLSDYHLLILHQLPGTSFNSETLLAEAINRNIPHMFILGQRTHFEQFNRLSQSLKFSGRAGSVSESMPSLNLKFSFFALPDEAASAQGVLPPLNVPYGNFTNVNPANVLGYQQIGSVKTELPLIYLDEKTLPRHAVICGTGVWRWRLYEYEKLNHTRLSDGILGQVIQFLVTRDDKSKFRVFMAKGSMYENERAILQAVVYDANNESTISPDVELTLKNSDGKTFKHKFTRATGQYSLDLGNLPAGSYTYRARVAAEYDYNEVSGSFLIMPLQLEEQNLRADYSLLQNLSEQSGGRFLSKNDWDKIPEILSDLPAMTPISYMETNSRSLLDEWWWLAFIILWLTLEWFTRRRTGFY